MGRVLLFLTKAYGLDILRPIEAAALERGHEVAWLGLDASRGLLKGSGGQLLGPAAAVAWKPDALVTHSNWAPSFLPGLKVQVFHGFSVGKRKPGRGHFRIRGLFDLYCTQGPDTTQPFAELAERHGNFRVRETGWSKVDSLFRPDPAPWPVASDRPTVLFGSTFTPALSAAPHLLEEIERMASTGRWNWLVTLHPKLDQAWVERYAALSGPHLAFVPTLELMPALKAADVLLTDTSSIASEFVLQQRPVVTFRNRAVQPHQRNCESIAEVEGSLEAALERPASLLEEIARYVRWIHPYRDGRSSQRVVQAIEECVDLGRTGLKRRPWVPLRRLSARRKLGYWGV